MPGGKGPKIKGDKLERELVTRCAKYGIVAKRTRNDSDAGDSDVFIDAADFDIWAQCKAGNSHSVPKALAQAVEGTPQNEKCIPIVYMRRDREEPFVVMRAEDFFKLVVR